MGKDEDKGKTDKKPKPPPKTDSDKERGEESHHHHHHGVHHHHDVSYLVWGNKHDKGVRITRLGLYINLAMAIAKGFGGLYFNSRALLADGVHSLTDLISDFMTLFTISWALRAPSPEFPAGYGKIESLGSLGVSGILLSSGVLMGWAAFFQLTQIFFPGLADMINDMGFTGHHSHIHDHAQQDYGDPVLGPDINAAWLALGSILVKEYLYRTTMKIAAEKKSSVLSSYAYHHRVDSLTALVALVLIGGANMFENASWLDPVGGLAISLIIIQAGWGHTLQSIYELADKGVDHHMRNRVHDIIEKVANQQGRKKDVTVRYVQGVKAGQSYLMDAELVVPGAWTVAESQGIEKKVREKLAEKQKHVKRLRIRFVPKEEIGRHEVELAEDEFVPVDLSDDDEKHHHHKKHHHHEETDSDSDTEKKPKKKKKTDDSDDEAEKKKKKKKKSDDSDDESDKKKKKKSKDDSDDDSDKKKKHKKKKDDSDSDSDSEKKKKHHHHHKKDDSD
ncbi:MAG: hypothetical protein Q9162_004822 [Coniocarpon cinnabarinum]